MASTAEQIAKMDTKCAHIGTSLTTHPKDSKVSLSIVIEELELIHVSHSELLLDS